MSDHGVAGPLAADLARCVHCGMCLSACPTYLETGLEAEGPRGRIALMRAVQEGVLPLSAGVVGHLESCIQCRACEDVCPSGVPYGRMMEAQRVVLRDAIPSTLADRVLDRAVYRGALEQPGLVMALAKAGKVAGKLGATRLARALPVAGGVGRFAPDPDPARLPPYTHAQGTLRGRVALLEGCVMPALFGRVNLATARVCAAMGFEVVAPPGQGCCGALHGHRGLEADAHALARRSIEAFEASGADWYVLNSAGCGAAMREYGQWFAAEGDWAERAAAFSAKVLDVSEFLVRFGLPELGPVQRAATLQESCHLNHAQRVKDPPKAVLRAIPGLMFRPMAESDVCCGSGGMYTVLQPAMSQALLGRTMDNAAAVAGLDTIVTSNPGCMLQLQAGVRERGLPVQVMHLVEVVDEAIRAARPGQGMEARTSAEEGTATP